MHQNLLAPQKRPMCGSLFRTGAPGVPQGCPPCQDGLRTAHALRPTSPTKYVAGTSSGAAADKLPSENTTGHVLRTYLPILRTVYVSAEVCGLQTLLLTGSVEIPLTGPEATAPVQKLLPEGAWLTLFEHRRNLCSTYLFYIRKSSMATTHLPLDSLKNTELDKCISMS